MKFSAAILLQIMLVFFTLPLTHNLVSTYQSCKADKCADMCPLKSKHKQESDNNCNRSCNPLVNCPFCQYISIEKFTLSNISFPVHDRFNISRNENAVFSYNKKCWHPPEMV